MEVLAAEFPDIFTQYIEIVPEVTVPTVEPTVVPVLSQVSDIDTAGNVTSRTIQDIFLEHDYGQKAIVQEDANKNFSKTDFSNTVFSSEENTDTEENLLTEHETEQQYLVESPTWSQYDELDQIIEDLRHCDEDSNSNILLSLENLGNHIAALVHLMCIAFRACAKACMSICMTERVLFYVGLC